jgi:hypothetical protein
VRRGVLEGAPRGRFGFAGAECAPFIVTKPRFVTVSAWGVGFLNLRETAHG